MTMIMDQQRIHMLPIIRHMVTATAVTRTMLLTAIITMLTRGHFIPGRHFILASTHIPGSITFLTMVFGILAEESMRSAQGGLAMLRRREPLMEVTFILSAPSAAEGSLAIQAFLAVHSPPLQGVSMREAVVDSVAAAVFTGEAEAVSTQGEAASTQGEAASMQGEAASMAVAVVDAKFRVQLNVRLQSMPQGFEPMFQVGGSWWTR
jgi:hypothetical protein